MGNSEVFFPRISGSHMLRCSSLFFKLIFVHE